MWRCFPDVEPPPKKKKTDKKMQDNKYDQTKRKFIPSWKSTYPWVKYDSTSDKMFCQMCLDHPRMANKQASFFVGSNNFVLCSLKSHSSSKEHLRVENMLKVSATPIGQSVAEKTLKQLNESIV